MKLYKSLGEVDIDKEIVVTKHECYHIDCEENEENKRILVDFFEIYDNKLDMDINIDIRPISFNKTAWSSNVKSIFIKSGITFVSNIERGFIYNIHRNSKNIEIKEIENTIFKKFHDRMIEEVYHDKENDNNHIEYEKYLLKNKDEVAINKLNDILTENGIILDNNEIKSFVEKFGEYKNPMLAIFDLVQSDSEHCRHHFFNGKLIRDNTLLNYSLFDLVKKTLKVKSKSNSLVAFNDNSSCIVGSECKGLCVDKEDMFKVNDLVYDYVLTAETHNFPSAIAPFEGGATGTGGRIRDVQATGIGAITVAGSAGYSVGNIYINERDESYPENIELPINILIGASNGASDYGNKFGEPLIVGFTRNLSDIVDGRRREWMKPIMFTSGIGLIDHRHIYKKEIEKDMLIAKIGGPAYKIGVGGGSSSSKEMDSKNAELDYNAVQRADPKMEQNMNRALRRMIDMGEKNPIITLHDQGAGGNANVIKELVENKGGIVDLSKFTKGDESMSDIELWISEYQESNAFVIREKDRLMVEEICKRENVLLDIVGKVTESGYLEIEKNGEEEVKISLEEKKNRKEYNLKKNTEKKNGKDMVYFELSNCIERVLKELCVGSKRFLTNKVDRSVTGLIAQQQCVGSLHTPLSNYGLISQSYFRNNENKFAGCVKAIGEQPIFGLLDIRSMVQKTVAEMLTNMMWVLIDSIEDIRCSANWMWACPNKNEEEGNLMVEAVEELSRLLINIGVAIDGGKDSLSMTVKNINGQVDAPGTLVLTGYARCPDICKKVTPNIKSVGSNLIFIDLSEGNYPLGGTVLQQSMMNISGECSIIRNEKNLVEMFNLVQDLLKEDKILSGHDKSDGGLITTLLEMSFSGCKGVEIDINTESNVIDYLFNEEIGVVIEVSNENVSEVMENISKRNLKGFNIGRVVDKDLVIIRNRGEGIYKSEMSYLRGLWEKTSNYIERKQGVTERCLEQEEFMYKKDIRIEYSNLPEIRMENGVNNIRYNVGVIREEGSNSDKEMAASLIHAGFNVIDINSFDITNNKVNFNELKGIVFVGGFSFSDALGSARGWEYIIKNNSVFSSELDKFVKRSDTFILGICNGCQLLMRLGLIEGFNGKRKMGVNISGRFESRFPTCKVTESKCILTKDMDEMKMGIWIANKEGNFDLDEEEYKILKENGQICLEYIDNKGVKTEEYPFNPSGSKNGVAALCSRNGRVIAMMPHPERSFLDWQLPWISDDYKLEGKYSPWFNIFKNAYYWIDREKNLVVVGGGSREHVIAEKLSESDKVNRVYVIPGNDGINMSNNKKIMTVPIKEDDFENIYNFVKENNVRDVIVGPENPLDKGIIDYLSKLNVRCFGPTRGMSIIESSKAYSKKFMKENNIPTAKFEIFTEFEEGKKYLENNFNNNLVIKASGLAAGKGVILPESFDEAVRELEEMMCCNKFGKSGDTVIIEEKLVGREVSVLGFCDGKTVKLMPQCQDYKKIFDGDIGLNTGGMGSHAPVDILNEKQIENLEKDMNIVVKKMNYIGILYAGVMLTENGYYILEFNCRFGDPETQAILNLLDSDLYSIFDSCIDGNICDIKWKDMYAANIVVSHGDYPVSKSKNYLMIEGLENVDNEIRKYYAGVKNIEGKLHTTGGRVISLVYCHKDLKEALQKIYNNIYKIKYDNIFYRRDIGYSYMKYKNTNVNERKKIRIGILGSTRGTSCKRLIEETLSGNISATIEVIISNEKNAEILDKAKLGDIDFICLSKKERKKDYNDKLLNILECYTLDVIFLVGYMKIIPKKIVEKYEGRMYNIHPSLLPKYKNMMDRSVHEMVISNGERITGCTLHLVSEKVDEGDIILQKQMIVKTDNPEELKSEVQKLESELLIEYVNMISMKKREKINYESAGVNIDMGNKFVDIIKKVCNEKDNKIGGFSGLFPYKNIILAASTDGVGTKIEIAKKLNKYDTIGIDLVAMCVNDLIVQGAKPLFFLDYIATDRIKLDQCEEILRGIHEGCKIAGCKLIGGETAEMPGFYPNNNFDLAGFSVGAIENDKMFPRKVNEGDLIFGLKSSGVHSNGYSLVRKLLKENNYSLEELLVPTKIYVNELDIIISDLNCYIRGFSHITGGGIIDNLPRVLSKGNTFKLDKKWEIPNVFKWIKEKSGMDNNEMLRTFNCGIGMIVIVDKNINLELDELHQKYELIHIGEIISGLDPVIKVNVE